jgi:hypothetical protein
VAHDPSTFDKDAAVGLGIDNTAYVLADRTCNLPPEAWARVAVTAYREFKADRIVAEQNFGGDMVRAVLHTVDRNVPVPKVRFASDSLLEGDGCKLSVPPKARTPIRLLILDHEQLIGRGFGSPDLTLAASKLPHAGAHTPGMADKMRAMSREGRAPPRRAPKKWCRRYSTSSSAKPTTSTAAASRPISWT